MKKIAYVMFFISSASLFSMQQPDGDIKMLKQNLEALKDSLVMLKDKMTTLNLKLDQLKNRLDILPTMSDKDFEKHAKQLITLLRKGDVEAINLKLALFNQDDLLKLLKSKTIAGMPILHWIVYKSLNHIDQYFTLILKSICARLNNASIIELKGIEYKEMDLAQYIKSLEVGIPEEILEKTKELLKI